MYHLLRYCTTLLSVVLPVARASTTISGFVTRAGTPESYFVNEQAVKCVPGNTRLRTLISSGTAEESTGCRQWVVVEQLTIEGDRDKKSDVMLAKQVKVDKPIPLAVDGFAIVDRVLVSPSTADGSIRADGYTLHISPGTKISFAEKSSLSLLTIGPNRWVRYAGTLRTDGSVMRPAYCSAQILLRAVKTICVIKQSSMLLP